MSIHNRLVLSFFSTALLALPAAADFAYKAELTISGYSGSTTLQNFPVLVRLSPDRIDGFKYSRCQADGKDILFTSPDGETVYPHEIDTWNPDGESLVWVNVPALSGTDTKMIFWFGDPSITAMPIAKDTWATANGGFYAGVWHLGEEATAETAMSVKNTDSAKHGTLAAQSMDLTPLATKPDGGTEEKISVEGVVGVGRQNGLTTGGTVTGNGLRAGYRPTSFSDFTKGQFTFSTWLKVNDYSIWTVIAGTKTEAARTGWWLQINSKSLLTAYGDYSTTPALKGVSATMSTDMTKDGWFHLTMTFDQEHVTFYRNGEFVTEGDVSLAPTADYNLFHLGQGPYRVAASYDEARILSTVASADWAKAEYETATVDDYLTYGKAQKLTEDSFVITAEPEQLGTVVPAYGAVTELDSPILCSAPDEDVAVSDVMHIAFRGWELYRADDDGNWQLVDSAATNSLLYVHPRGTSDKLVWQIVRKYPIALTAEPTGSGSFGVDGVPVQPGTVWCEESDLSVTLTATPAQGFDFLWWGGSAYGRTDEELEVSAVPGSRVAIGAHFLSNGEGHEPTNVWWIAASGNWSDGANWSGGAAPQRGDTVYLTNCVATSRITVDAPLPHFARLVVGNPLQTVNQSTTLETRNWMTRIDADEIVVQSRGVITCASAFSNNEMSNRVWLVGRNLTVENGGRIDVDAKGYRGANGPAWGGESVSASFASGVYGGAYGGYPVQLEPQPYGSAEEPADPGSGSGEAAGGGVGGGAIRLDFTGDVVLDGTISAKPTSNANSVFGSGGGVWVTCRTISGSGTVDASGGNFAGGGEVYCGGGGRIAVHYDAAAQSNAACAVSFYAAGGGGYDFYYNFTPVAGTKLLEIAYARGGEDGVMINEPGTLWFTDNQFLDAPGYRAAGLPFGGRWMSAEARDELVFEADQTLRCGQLVLEMAVRAEGDVTLQAPGWYMAGFNGGLIVDGAGMTVKGDLTLEGSRLELRGGKLTVEGNLEQLANDMEKSRFRGGTLALKAAPTNAPNAFGVELQVDGNWHIAANAVVYPYCEPTNGAIPKMSTHSLTVDEGGRIDADGHGWRMKMGPGCQTTSHVVGSSHGGRGGTGTAGYLPYIMPPYGNRKMPQEAGSGGKSTHTHTGFDGGGVVYLNVEDALTLNGTISADGNTKVAGDYAGGSSGGSIFINAFRFAGETGLLRAQGGFSPRAGTAYAGATGGGGRIAVRTGVTDWTEEMWAEHTNVRAGEVCADPGNTSCAEDGTFFWKAIGGLMLMVR